MAATLEKIPKLGLKGLYKKRPLNLRPNTGEMHIPLIAKYHPAKAAIMKHLVKGAFEGSDIQ